MDREIEKYYNIGILEETCTKYGMNYSEAKLIRENANLIFDCGDKILRLSHSSLRSKREIESEIDWVLFLKKEGLPVVEVLPSKENRKIVQIGGDENHFSGVCFKKIQGHRVLIEEWNEHHFEKLGSLSGKLHRVGQKYEENPEIEYKDWNEIPEFHYWKYLPKDERDLLGLHNLLVELNEA